MIAYVKLVCHPRPVDKKMGSSQDSEEEQKRVSIHIFRRKKGKKKKRRSQITPHTHDQNFDTVLAAAIAIFWGFLFAGKGILSPGLSFKNFPLA